MKPAPSRSGRAGFSLIEIMFVIVIIAVVGGIAIPALFATVKRAEWSKTRGQMRAIVSAFHTYAADHNNFMPPAYYPNGERQGRWLDSTIFVHIRDPEAELLGTQQTGTGGAGGGDGEEKEDSGFDSKNGSHLQDTVFACSASLKAFPDDENFYNHTFLLNRSLIAPPGSANPDFAPRPLSSFTDWASIMLLAEGPEGNNNSVGVGDWDQLEEGMERYEGRFAHFAYLDGHVEQIRPSDLKAMRGVAPGSGGNAQDNAWHTAWYGVTPDRFPTTGNGPGVNVNY